MQIGKEQRKYYRKVYFFLTRGMGGGGGEGGEEEINLTSPNSPELLSPNSPRKTHADPSLILNTLRIKNSERIIIGHLNVNHIENKFEHFVSLVKDKLVIIVLSETKIDESFPSGQFAIEGYVKPYRRDRKYSWRWNINLRKRRYSM